MAAALPSSTVSVTPWKATKFVRHCLPLVKPCWLSPSTSSCFVCLSTTARRISFMNLAGTKVTVTGLYLPSSSFLLFLFPLFQSVGVLLNCHDFSNMMESALATSPVFYPQMCLIRSPRLIHPQLPVTVSNLIPSYCGQFLILPIPVFAFCDLGGMMESLLVRKEAKNYWAPQPSPHPR